jgi:O-antigen/teichoic acid export membrane protein
MKISKTDSELGWRSIGVHRSIASFWFNFVLLLLTAIPMLLLVGFVLPNYILPYPEALGYRTITIGYFALFFSLMDLSTGSACERYVAQYAEIDPTRAMHYLSFFMYFQMFTGVIQVTGIAIFSFTYLVNSPLSYAIWFFIIYSLVQWPGMLGAYKSALRAYQRFDKANIIDLIQGLIFETVTQIGFIILGRWWGSHNPAIGEVMGATIGFIIGKELDDVFALFLSAYFMQKVLKPYGVSIKETIIPSFTREEAKETLIYGLKLIGAPMISNFTEFLTLLMLIEWLPSYAMIMGYLEIAKMFADLVGGRYNFSAFTAQAYNNGKKKLTEYLVTQYFKHWWYFAFFLTLEISMLIPPVLLIIGGNYADAAWLIPIYVFPRLLVQPPVMGAEILQACDRPEHRTMGIVVEKVVKMISVFLFLSPWGLVAVLGSGSLIILYVLHDIPAYLAISLYEFGMVHLKCVKVKINIWQTFVAGSLASLPLIPINLVLIRILNEIAAQADSLLEPIIFIVGMIIVLFFVLPLIVFFFYGLTGGWDDIGLQEFERAIPLCGPSIFLVRIFYRATAMGHRWSPLKNKFPNPHHAAYQEIAELSELIRLKEGQS